MPDSCSQKGEVVAAGDEVGMVGDACVIRWEERGVAEAVRVMLEDAVVMRGGRWALRDHEGRVVEDVDGMPEGERAMVEAEDATPKGAVVMGGGRAGFGDHEGGMVEVVRVMRMRRR